MILGTPAKDEKLVLTKYKNKRIHVQNDIREIFNDTNTVTNTCHITFSTRKLFLQMHLTNLNTALQRLIQGTFSALATRCQYFVTTTIFYVWISKYGIKEIFIDRRQKNSKKCPSFFTILSFVLYSSTFQLCPGFSSLRLISGVQPTLK